MGELPPSRSTPQGPGVPWALRPRFPRVDSSRTSRVLLSRSVISHFAHLLSPRGSPPSSRSPFPLLAILTISLHGPIQLPPRISPPLFARVSLRFLPFPCVQFSPLCSPRRFQFQSLFPFHAYLFGIVLCLGFGFPHCWFGFAFPQLPPPFPPVFFPFLPFPCVQFSPVLSTFVLFGSPVVFPPTWRSDYPPFSFQISGSTAAFSRLGFCGPRVAPKRPHTGFKEAAKFTGQAAVNKPLQILEQYSGNKGHTLLISTVSQTLRSPLNLSIISFFLASSSKFSESALRRRESTFTSTK